MNKGELIQAIAKDAKITKTAAEKVIDSFVTNVQKSLKRGDKVTLVGFGTFSASKRAARTGRNPQTGQPINIPAKRVAKFRPGRVLRDAIGGLPGEPPEEDYPKP